MAVIRHTVLLLGTSLYYQSATYGVWGAALEGGQVHGRCCSVALSICQSRQACLPDLPAETAKIFCKAGLPPSFITRSLDPQAYRLEILMNDHHLSPAECSKGTNSRRGTFTESINSFTNHILHFQNTTADHSWEDGPACPLQTAPYGAAESAYHHKRWTGTTSTGSLV